MKPANYGPFYAAGLYPKLAEIFRAHGYALAVHGSLANDFDLIAVPWVENAGDPQVIIEEVNSTFAARFSKTDHDPRPHGRSAYKLALSFGDCALDVSFMPRARMETRSDGPSPHLNYDKDTGAVSVKPEALRAMVETLPVADLKPITTWEPDGNGSCKRCGLSWFLHISEDSHGRTNVCAPITTLNRGTEHG